jgi:putative transposase
MPTHRHSLQTYALTVVTDQRRRILQTNRNAVQVIATLFRHRDVGRLQLHGFVVMPDYSHALITPAIDHGTSRCVQLIKAGSWKYSTIPQLDRSYSFLNPFEYPLTNDSRNCCLN